MIHHNAAGTGAKKITPVQHHTSLILRSTAFLVETNERLNLKRPRPCFVFAHFNICIMEGYSDLATNSFCLQNTDNNHLDYKP